MNHGTLTNGRLDNIKPGPPMEPNEVEVIEIPVGPGPWAYDPVTKTAIPAVTTVNEDLAIVRVPQKVFAVMIEALALLPPAAKSNWPAWVNQTINNAKARVDGIIAGRTPDGNEGS